MGADVRERNIVVGQGQQVVEEDAIVSGPGEMLREQRRLIDFDEALQPREMLAIERRGAADGETDAVDRKRIVRPDALKQMMRGTAVAHIVFGMDLEKVDPARLIENIVGMFGLKAGAGGRSGHGRNGRFV